MRTVAVVTVGRSDFGIYLPILRAIEREPDLRLHLIATGAHLAPQFGSTVDEITSLGFEIGDRVETCLASSSSDAVAASMGLTTLRLAQVYARVRPDVLLILGDRYEMHAAAVAAVPFRIPIAHVHGGEVTIGAIDDAFRHAITKYSHLHFVSTEEHGRRVVQLGEEPWRVVVSGAPALDNLAAVRLLDRPELETLTGISFDPPPVLVTYHPVTLEFEQAGRQVEELLAALDSAVLSGDGSRSILITKPNADTNCHAVLEKIEEFGARHSRVRVVDSLGTTGYFSVMKRAAAMVGNSSSGIIEAASFELPVVNVGIRQMGRPASRNVLHVGNGREEIAAAIERVLDPEFRRNLGGLVNPYGDGQAAAAIVARLKSQSLDREFLTKRFYDLPRRSETDCRAADAAA